MSGAILTGRASIGIRYHADFRRFLPIIQHGVPACSSRGARRAATSSYVPGLFFWLLLLLWSAYSRHSPDQRYARLRSSQAQVRCAKTMCFTLFYGIYALHNLYHLPWFVVPYAKRPLFTRFLGPPWKQADVCSLLLGMRAKHIRE